ncbi:transposase [Streptomyces paradoxus]|uniref:transposase n=1 Tax=Streptomyces paradoxus TaxID=66375 RepID=UPI00381C931B
MQLRLAQSVVGPGVPLTDPQWARIEPLLPDRTPKLGGRWRDHREVIDAIASHPPRLPPAATSAAPQRPRSPAPPSECAAYP